MSGHKYGKFSGADAKRAVAFLRALHPMKTGAAVEAETGISAETYRKWADGKAQPSWPHVFALIGAYGPAFMVAVLDQTPKWLDEAYRAQKFQELERRHACLQAEMRALMPGE